MPHFYLNTAVTNFSKKLYLAIILIILGTISLNAQNCTVNAGILNVTICETDALVLEGSTPTPIIGTVSWTQISGPTVVINSPNSTSTTVSGYTGGNTYIFRYSATCGDGVLAYQDKVVNVQPITQANAGANIASCPNSSGTLTISANAPQNSGETGLWEIVGANNAGVVINFPNLPTSTITLPATSCGVTTIQWVIEGPEYAAGQRCRTTSQITVTNYGGVKPVSAGPDQSLSNCYTTTQSTNLNGTYGGCGLNGQNGQWTFVSGPNTPTISNPGSNNTQVSNLIEGTYTFRWTVTGPCASGNDLVTITVPPATQDVTVIPGGDENISFCDNTITQVTLQAQTPLYAGETVLWTQISGAPATIVSPTNPTTLITGISDAGDPYKFRYTLTNNNTGCVFSKDYNIVYYGATRTIVANNGDDIVGSCDETVFDIDLAVTGSGINQYRIVSGPSTSPLGPFPTAVQTIGNSLTLTLTVSGDYTVEFIRRENGSLPIGCDYGFDSLNILVSGDPTPSNAGSDVSLPCGDTTTILSGVVTGDGRHLWSQLSGPNDAVIADAFAVDTQVSGLIPGTYVFQYITKGGGATCGFSVSTVTIYVSGSNLVDADAGSDQLVCVNSQVPLAAAPAQAGEIGTWSQVSGPNPITFSNVNDPNAIATGFASNTSVYRLRWSISYLHPGPSCSSSVSDDVDIITNNNTASSISDAGDDACYPSGTTSFNLSGNTVPSNEFGTWTVVPSAGVTFSDITDPNALVTVPGSGTYTFTWTITSILRTCISNTDDVKVTIAETPLANAGPDQEICGNTITMAATASSGSAGTWTRISGFGNYTISDEHDPNAVFTFTYSGFYIFRWTVNADTCGQAFDDINLTIGIPPNPASAGPDQNVCNSTSVTMAANTFDSFFESGKWSVLTGAPNQPNIVDPSDPNTVINGLVAGTYTFRWTMSAKSVFVCPGTSDDVTIVVTPAANAGADQSFCDVTSVQLVGNENSTGTWTLTSTSGNTADVVITQSPPNSYVANATVVPGNSYVFTYTTASFTNPDNSICAGSSDSVNIQIFSGASVDPNAGPDQTLCIADVGGIATLAGNSPPADVSVAEWRFVFQPSGNVAVIDNPNSPTTTVSNLTVPGLYILEWVFESTSCRNLSDIVRIEMNAAPSTANAGPDDTVACQTSYQTAAVPPTVGIGTWSFANPGDDPSNGAVVIDSPNSPVTTLSNITTLGTYVLTWTVTNGPFTSPSLCSPSSDTVSITFNDNPPSVAHAGPDQELCDVANATMAATPVLSGVGTWTQVSGPNTAAIGAPNDPNSVMLGLVPGTYEFLWTTTTLNANGCTSEDSVLVTIYDSPSTAFAGPNQTIPQFQPVNMNATVPAVGTGIWTQVSGPSTVGFVNETSPTTGVTGTVSGTYELRWTVSNGNCPVSSDTMLLTILSVADLELTKTVTPARGSAGNVVTFNIQVFNNNSLGGTVDATNVAVRDYLPTGFTIVPGSVNLAGQYNIGNKTITWSNLTIPNGDRVNLTFDATIDPNGSYVNVAEIIASDQFDSDSTPNNNILSEDDQDDAEVILDVADLSLQKSVSPSTVSINDGVIFTITVTNSGPNNGTGIRVLDRLPAGYTYVSDNGAGKYNNTTGIWNVGNLNNGNSISLQIRATVNVTGPPNYINVAEIQTADQLDPDSTPGNGLAEDDMDDAVITLQTADLELTKAVSPTSAAAGDQVQFTLNLANKGPGDATGIDIRDIIPTGYTLVPGSVSNGGIYQTATAALEWQNLVLANGSNMNLTFTATVNPSGTYLNTAQITASDLPDPDSTPNNDTGSQTEDDEDNASITFIGPSADLSLVKNVVAGNTSPVVGTQVSFELVITNGGPNNATGVQIADLLPSGYEFINYSSSAGLYNSTTGIWNVGTVDSGVSESLILDAKVLATGNYTNITQVTASDLPDPDSTPNNDDGDQSEDDEANAVVTPIPASSDLSLTKTVNNATPLVGTQVTFEIVVTNNGPQDNTGVQITDSLPSGYTFSNYTVSTGTYNSATGVWTIGNLANSKIETLQLTATVNAGGDYLNIAEITGADVPDPDSTPNNNVTTEDDYASAATTPVALSSDLSLTKTVNNATPVVGSQVTFEVVVTNNGPQDNTGIQVTDLLPSGYTYVGFTVSTGTYNPTTGLWTVGNLLNGDSETLQIRATVNSTGIYLNSAEVTASDLPDPDSTPNNGTNTEDDYAEIATVPTSQSSDLSLTKTVNNPTPLVGSQVTFSVQVSNAGPQDTNGVAVTDLLPSGYTYVSYTATAGNYDAATGLWTVGSVLNGASHTLQITATVNPTGTYLNTAEVTASSLPDPDSTPNNAVTTEDDYAEISTIPVLQSADLSLTKTVNNATPLVGSQVTFSVQVSNAGPQDTNGVAVTDLLPSGYTYVSYTSTAGNYDAATGLWTVGSLLNSASQTLQITATVNATGTYLNTAEVTASSLPDPDSTPNNAVTTEDDYAEIATVPVLQSADLSITKTVNNATPLVGSQVTFSVQVSNAGPQDTNGVAVTDLLPTGYTYVSYTATAGSYDSVTGLWTVGSLLNGASHTLQIIATVNSTGTYLNTAEVTASSLPDPDSTPNNGTNTEDDYATATITPVALSSDLSLTKIFKNTTEIIGDPITFEIVVTNNGPQNNTGVQVTDLLPSGYTFTSFTNSTGTYNSATGIWDIGNLPSGQSETLQIIAIINDAGIYQNVAEVTTADLIDPDSTPNNGVVTEDDYASATITPIRLTFDSDLSLTKTVNNTTPLVGSQVTFEIVVTNNGTLDNTGVQVTDLLPSGYTYNSYSISSGTYNPATGLWIIGNIINGKSETLQITATVNPTGNYTNSAEVTATDVDDFDSDPNNGPNTEDDYAEATTTPISQASDLSLTKTVSNATPLVGSQVTFSVQVSNAGPQDTNGIAVTDLLPTGYTYVSYTATAGSYDSTTGLWTVGSLLNGASHTLQITATVNSTGIYLNSAEVTASSLPDPDSTPNNAVTTEDDYAEIATIPVLQSADLSITKTVNNSTPLVGSQVTFSVQVSNAGPQDTNGVAITDLLPTGYTYVSYTATAGNYDSATGLWTVGSLLNGASHTLQITATVNSTGIYLNSAEVTASSLPDPDSAPNNTVTTEDDYAEIATVPTSQSSDLSLTKTVNNATPLVGSQVTFEVVVTNNGPQDNTGVQVTDLLPTGYNFSAFTVSTGTYNPTTGLWTVGNLNNGQSETLQITANVNPTGDYLNIAEITAAGLQDPDSTPNNAVTTEDDYAEIATVPVLQSADLSITKTVNNATPLVGSQVTFSVQVNNAGPQDTNGVAVTDLLPTGYTYVSYTATVGNYDSVTGLWTVGSLLNGASQTLQITATVNPAGVYLNSAEVTASSLPDPDSAPNNAVTTEEDYAEIATVPVLQSADLSLTKTVNNATPLVGSQITFSVQVSNAGPQDTNGITVTDLLPTGYTYVSYTATAGSYDSATGLWTVGSVLNGASHTLQITASVNSTGTYLNSAEVTASDLPDPDSTPNNGTITEDDYAEIATVPVLQSADLFITKTVNNQTPLVGSQVTFEVVVTNNGPQDNTGVQVTDLLPTGYTFSAFTVSTGTYNPTTGLWTVGNLNNGKSETLQITAIVNPAGNYLNIAEITAAGLQDPDSTPNNASTTEDDYATATITPTSQASDLSITKTVNNTTPLVGSQVTFEVVVTNNGPQDNTGVQVTDLLPTGYTFSAFTVSTGTYNPTTGLWTVGNLNNGQSETLQVTATVNLTGYYTNIAEITAASLPDPDSTPNNGAATEDDYATATTVPITQASNLSLTKTVNNATPLIGSSVTFEVIITNSGPQNTAGVAVTDLLPTGYTFGNYTATKGTYNKTTGRWNIGSLLNGDSQTLQITATVNASGNYVNVAEVTASNLPDPNSTPNNGVTTEDDYATATVSPTVPMADLSLTKAVIGGNLSPIFGATVTFEITVKNSGPQAATGVSVKDLLPSGYEYIVYSSTAGQYFNTTGIWNIGTIPNGGSESLLIGAKVNTTGDYNNIAEVYSSNEPDPDSTPNNNVAGEDDINSVLLTPVPSVTDLSIEKKVVGNNLTPAVGSQISFTVIVTNDGPSISTGVTIKDILPSGYQYTFFNSTSGSYNATTGIWTPGIILPGNSATLLINAFVKSPTGKADEYLNTAEIMTSDQHDPDSTPGNGITTEDDYDSISVTPVIVMADLSITKTALNQNTTYDVGSTVIFTVTVTNDGPADASGVVVKDLLPPGFKYVTSSPTSGLYNYVTGIWNAGIVPAGNNQSVDIYTTVNPPTGVAGEYTNTTEITASNLPDPDSTPNNGVTTEDDYDSLQINVAIADLSLDKSVSNKNANVNEVITFTLQLGNTGPSTATGVNVDDIIPLGYRNITNISNGGIFSNNTIKWANLTVPVGGITLTYQVTVANPKGLDHVDYLNMAQVTASNQFDPDSKPNNDNGDQSEDDEDSEFINIPSTDIAINKEVDKTDVPMYSSVVFTITAENLGNLAATNVEVKDLLPKGYELETSTATSGTYDGKTGIWTIPSVAPKGSQTLTLNVKVVDFKDYLNIAQLVSMDQIDTNASNNQDSATVQPNCLKIWNEFSPNDDGQNDTFYIDCITQYPDNQLSIFNRWGNLIYFKKGYDNTWDGKEKGSAKTLPDGTYFYILDLGDGSEKTSGWLYLKN